MNGGENTYSIVIKQSAREIDELGLLIPKVANLKPISLSIIIHQKIVLYLDFQMMGKINTENDKFGRDPHFHAADDIKGSHINKGRYNQHKGHFPENIEGF